jgi:outer membrane protein OmpA-like peptidoglycan-associated protein
MADLNVEPKKKTSILPWLLVALAVIAIIYFLSRRNDNDDAATTLTDSTSTSPAISSNTQPDSSVADSQADKRGNAYSSAWTDVDLNGPSRKYDEVSNKNIHVRGTDDYGVYDIGEEVLFDKDKSDLRHDAVDQLKQVAASIKKRYDQGQVRLYGFTDAQGDQQSNMALSQARAEAVSKWLSSEGGIDQANISINAQGESNPKASNATESGRKENRRVQIVVKKNK